MVPTVIGKKANTAAMTILDDRPKPSHTMSRGTIATFGRTWRNTRYGVRARSRTSNSPSRAPVTSPKASARANPMRISWRVTQRWDHVAGSLRTSPIPASTSSGGGSTKRETSLTST